MHSFPPTKLPQIKQMELEVRSHDVATRKVLSEKVNNYKKSLTAHRNDYEHIRDSAQRTDLMGKSGEQKQRFLDTNDKSVLYLVMITLFLLLYVTVF
jgi:hypothetical protein